MAKSNPRNNIRAKMIKGAIMLFFTVCVCYLAWLQLVQGEVLAAREEENKQMLQKLQSPRGSICDRNGQELAVSLVSLSLYVDPLAMDDPRNFSPKRDPRAVAADILAEPLGRNRKELYDIFKEDRHFVWLERTMDKAWSDRINGLRRENELRGFGFHKESKRYYPMGKLGAQILGFVGTDDFGLSGIEMAYDSILKSAVQTQFIDTDSDGRPILSSVLQSNKARKMATVYMTIDDRVQFALEKALSAAVERTGAKSAAAVVMDVQTGEIMAMGGFPTFDPNYFDKFSQASWKNPVISTVYEPGSTFKPIVAAAAINEGIVGPDTTFYDHGKIKVGDREIKNSEGKALGSVLFRDVITYSINTNMVEIGLAMGKTRMTQYAKAFGFGSYTDIELPGEESGILFSVDKMGPVDIASMSIGQGIAVTPLQLVRAIAAIANNGQMVEPQIVKKIVDPNGLKETSPVVKPPRQVVTKETSQKVLAMMENVVLKGGGSLAQIKGYRIAGKTGTAEKLKAGGGYAQGEYIASFVGVAPVENPRFVALVLVDTPNSVYYGSQVAAPVFKEIMQQTLVLFGVEPSSPMEGLIPRDKAESFSAKQSGDPPNKPLYKGYTAVPDVKGSTMRDCARILQNAHLSLVPRGSGKAVRQEPEAFSKVSADTKVTVWFE